MAPEQAATAWGSSSTTANSARGKILAIEAICPRSPSVRTCATSDTAPRSRISFSPDAASTLAHQLIGPTTEQVKRPAKSWACSSMASWSWRRKFLARCISTPGVREICQPEGTTLVEKSLLTELSNAAVRPTGSAPGPLLGKMGRKRASGNSPAATCAASWADTPGNTPSADARALTKITHQSWRHTAPRGLCWQRLPSPRLSSPHR